LLLGISPLLNGAMLTALDAMGHGDSLVIADAHFPATRLATRLIELPGTTVTEVLDAVRSVIPLDDVQPLRLMSSGGEEPLPIHAELASRARLDGAMPEFVDRFTFYDLAATAFVIVRTGDQRTYANALLHKGIVR
jgi:L-fucose mutarotase